MSAGRKQMHRTERRQVERELGDRVASCLANESFGSDFLRFNEICLRGDAAARA